MENHTVLKEINDQAALFLSLCLSSPNQHHTTTQGLIDQHRSRFMAPASLFCPSEKVEVDVLVFTQPLTLACFLFES